MDYKKLKSEKIQKELTLMYSLSFFKIRNIIPKYNANHIIFILIKIFSRKKNKFFFSYKIFLQKFFFREDILIR